MTKTKQTLSPAGNPIRKENYNFQYNFTEEELKEKSKQLARSCDERNNLEDQKKSVMSDFKSKIDSKNAEINIASGHINNGYEWLTKTCDVEYDFDHGKKIFYYNDLRVGVEKMTKDDYQIKANLETEEAES